MPNTPTSCEIGSPEWFDRDYYEDAIRTGKGCYENYHWQPRRSYREALAFIDLMGIEEDATLLDVGCAKGYLVRAMRELYISAFGCDVSRYAIRCGQEEWADDGTLEVADDVFWAMPSWCDYAVTRDVLEHSTPEQIGGLLSNILQALKPGGRYTACVPLGDDGKFRIGWYHKDVSHRIIEDEVWWHKAFRAVGFEVDHFTHHVPGLKDNHLEDHKRGNGIWVLARPQR